MKSWSSDFSGNFATAFLRAPGFFPVWFLPSRGEEDVLPWAPSADGQCPAFQGCRVSQGLEAADGLD